jgi:hypothetical protein
MMAEPAMIDPETAEQIADTILDDLIHRAQPIADWWATFRSKHRSNFAERWSQLCWRITRRGRPMVYYVAGHAPIYIVPGHLYRCTAVPRLSDCVWMVPGDYVLALPTPSRASHYS